jgi:hypothetical protein
MTYYQKTYYKSAKKSEYKGSIYDSKFEAQVAQDLEMMKLAGEIISWERQITIPLEVNGYLVCNYIIDFIVYREGETEYIEAKGYPTPVWKLKWRLFEALYTKEGNKLTVIMQGKYKPPKLRKLKKGVG